MGRDSSARTPDKCWFGMMAAEMSGLRRTSTRPQCWYLIATVRPDILTSTKVNDLRIVVG